MLGASVNLLSKRSFGAALTFGTNLLIAKQLASSDYGQVVYLYSLVVLGSLVFRNGNHVSLPRDISQSDDPDSKNAIAVKEVSNVFHYALVLCAFFIVLLPASNYLIHGSVDWADIKIAILFSLAAIAYALCETMSAVYVGMKLPQHAALVSFVFPQAVLIALIYFLSADGVIEYGIMFLSAYGGVFVIAFIFFIRSISNFKPSLLQPSGIFHAVRENLPITSVILILYINVNMDIMLLGNIGKASDLALFSFIFKVAGSISMLSVVPRMISGPKFSELYGRNDIRGIYHEFRTITLTMTLIAIFSGMVIAALFPLLADFIDKYRDHQSILYAVLAGAVLNIMFGPLLLVLNMTDNNQSVWKTGLVVLVVKLVALVIIYNLFGLLAFSIFGSLFIVIWKLVLLLLMKSRLSLKPPPLQ